MKSIGVAIGAAEDELVHHGWFVRVVEEFWIIGLLFYEAYKYFR